MNSLLAFLRDISIDPLKMTEFLKDPNAAMAASGLDDHSRRVLFSGSDEAINDLLRDHEVAHPVVDRQSSVTAAEERGSLVVVGTGIRPVGQFTVAAISRIKASSVVYYVVVDPITEEIIKYLNPQGAVSLYGNYKEGVNRLESYEAMVKQIMDSVREGKKTCAAFYGHPGVFTYPAHESIRRARTEGYSAYMLPGISAEDCLLADLGIDPGGVGFQSFDATDFLLYDRGVDTSSQLILWQVGVVGDRSYRAAGYQISSVFPLLVEKLTRAYGPNHVGIIYEASPLPGVNPAISSIRLGNLLPSEVRPHSILYIPPAISRAANQTVAAAMGILR